MHIKKKTKKNPSLFLHPTLTARPFGETESRHNTPLRSPPAAQCDEALRNSSSLSLLGPAPPPGSADLAAKHMVVTTATTEVHWHPHRSPLSSLPGSDGHNNELSQSIRWGKKSGLLALFSAVALTWKRLLNEWRFFFYPNNKALHMPFFYACSCVCLNALMIATLILSVSRRPPIVK